jgi:cell division cycle 20-like protein 1 (cofactor of APC complex)
MRRLQVLDAPQLQDDFYLNLVDWSSQNVLAVGLGTCVYLWSACTSKVRSLQDAGALFSLSNRLSYSGVHLALACVDWLPGEKCGRTRQNHA